MQLWRCPNCGQVHFAEAPPDMCDFCRDFTTWQPIGTLPPLADSTHADEKRRKSRSRKVMVSPDQMRLFGEDM
jgi:hypothetical protein